MNRMGEAAASKEGGVELYVSVRSVENLEVKVRKKLDATIAK